MQSGRYIQMLSGIVFFASACADVPPLIVDPACDVEPCEATNPDVNNTPGNTNNNPFNNDPFNNTSNNQKDMMQPAECIAGTRECVDTKQYRVCTQDESGGPRWTMPMSCPREVCVGEGRCCENPCQPGEKICTANGVQTCEAGEDGCFAFSPPVPCQGNEVCDASGACVAGCTSTCTLGDRQCFPEGTPAYRECVEVEPGCFQVNPNERSCPAGQVCRGAGRCETNCTDECPGQENQLLCDVNTEKRCQRGADGCLDWVPTGNPCNVTPNFKGCQSATLGRFVPHATCVQTARNNTVRATCPSAGCKWAICHDGKWSYTCDVRPMGCATVNPHGTCP